MSLEDNPYIAKPEDYFAGYSQGLSDEEQNKMFEFQELNYRLFNSKDGAKWLNKVLEGMLFDYTDITREKNAALKLAFSEGKRQFVYGIKEMINAHAQFLKKQNNSGS